MTRLLALMLWLSTGSLFFPSSGSAVAGDEQIAGLLARQGVAPIEPPSTAIDLELSALDGGRVWLSSNQGWLVMTFWATWCQPCRVEMPTLEALATALDGLPVTILAVSVDADRGVVADFVEKVGVGLPVLWDQEGRAARAYGASSIPLTFVIDPQGRIVGVSRGARDWSGLAGMFRDLVGTAAESGSAVAWSREEEAVSLPMRLTPPAAEVALVDPPARVGAEFGIEVRVTWAGDFEEYVLRPPALPALEGVEQLGVSASTSTEMGSSVVAYRIALRAEHSGTLVIDPVELRYQPRFGEAPVSTLVDGLEVEVLPQRGAWGGRELAVAGMLAAFAGAGLWWRRSRLRDDGPPGVDPLAGCRQELEAARRHRHDGEGAEAVARLHAAVIELGAMGFPEVRFPEVSATRDRALVDELAGLRERCRFGGFRAPGEDLDRLQRRVELLIDQVSRSLPPRVSRSVSTDARPLDPDPASL